MKIKIGKTKFLISVPFCLLISTLLLLDKTGYMAFSLSAAAVHEFSHIIFMNIFHCPPHEITASLKGLIIVGGRHTSTKEEFLILLAGPLSNLCFAAVFYFIGQAFDWNTATSAAVVQSAVGIFNLLPISGLDGGSLLLIVLETLISPDKANFFAKLTSIAFSYAVLFFGISLLFKTRTNPTLLLLGIYLFFLNIPKLGCDS